MYTVKMQCERVEAMFIGVWRGQEGWEGRREGGREGERGEGRGEGREGWDGREGSTGGAKSRLDGHALTEQHLEVF